MSDAPQQETSALTRAAEAIEAADAIVIGAGAGMGVDSGLPDFRGPEGFWKAYPAFRDLGLNFVDLANPKWFRSDPQLAWGFYGHRLELYRDTRPHAGFALLRSWASAKEAGLFVFTSNVDGQFQRAGVADERIVECHGSIHQMQCAAPCSGRIWQSNVAVRVDEETCLAEAPIPACPQCGGVARPNILMFGDGAWAAERTIEQERRFADWFVENSKRKFVIVECGAGTSVPTVRWQCERAAAALDAPLVRINPRESEGPDGTISIALGALEALQAIEALR